MRLDHDRLQLGGAMIIWSFRIAYIKYATVAIDWYGNFHFTDTDTDMLIITYTDTDKKKTNSPIPI